MHWCRSTSVSENERSGVLEPHQGSTRARKGIIRGPTSDSRSFLQFVRSGHTPLCLCVARLVPSRPRRSRKCVCAAPNFVHPQNTAVGHAAGSCIVKIQSTNKTLFCGNGSGIKLTRKVIIVVYWKFGACDRVILHCMYLYVS
ncbi:hypothetical protein SORBI_3009G177750 [Sorghum bicolor]|uniref:Uncharacterized protein n=1 Tax=Sorghum bicolor TaxID=4558 RepID=A0A1B6P915_SORBI|nr:hypothetical protein SORBI_3009G177750 [Sorghum bicolor]